MVSTSQGKIDLRSISSILVERKEPGTTVSMQAKGMIISERQVHWISSCQKCKIQTTQKGLLPVRVVVQSRQWELTLLREDMKRSPDMRNESKTNLRNGIEFWAP